MSSPESEVAGGPAGGLGPALGVPATGLGPALGVPAAGLGPALGVPAGGGVPAGDEEEQVAAVESAGRKSRRGEGGAQS
jgi:hypothetical protein